MESTEAFIDRLPKVELHLHLVGSASVPTVLELRQRHPDGAGVPSSAADLAAFYEFRDFPHFSEVYGAVSSLVREPADVAELVLGAARDLAGQNARYAELTVTPYTFTSAGMPAAGLTEALDIAARSARREHGVRLAYIFDIAGEFGGPAAYGTLEHALSCPPEALTGFGLAGIEQARPAFADAFRSVFASAVAAGLHSVPHAGEMSGPATIWESLDGLRAERIGHGLSCLADPALVARLRESQIPLEVCPTSNVCTRQVDGLAAHPLPRMLEEGLFVTLNSDDPPMFGTTLTQEYRRAASVLGLSRGQLADLAANGVRASFLEPDAKRALLAEIAAVAAGDDGYPASGAGILSGYTSGEPIPRSSLEPGGLPRGWAGGKMGLYADRQEGRTRWLRSSGPRLSSSAGPVTRIR
jgi:aminodeoxyfutalosine deaminase